MFVKNIFRDKQKQKYGKTAAEIILFRKNIEEGIQFQFSCNRTEKTKKRSVKKLIQSRSIFEITFVFMQKKSLFQTK